MEPSLIFRCFKVLLSATKESLIGVGQPENRQEFETVPTLMELQYFLRVICQELKTYSVWPVSVRSNTTNANV